MTLADAPKTPLQVEAAFYGFTSYVHLQRWISYWYQIDAVLRQKPATVLEIGPGTGVTTAALRQAGVAVTTFDFDPALKPDIVGDVLELAQTLEPKSYDVVCIFQVLEHLPFERFEAAVAALATVARHKVVISLPHWGYPLELRFRLLKDRFRWAFARKFARPKTWSFDGQHHWELGTRGHGVADIAAVLGRHLTIEKQYFCPDYSYHYFFECAVAGR